MVLGIIREVNTVETDPVLKENIFKPITVRPLLSTISEIAEQVWNAPAEEA